MTLSAPRAASGDAPTVAVVYHFFAHYRAAVMRALLDSPHYRFVLCGDVRNPEGPGIREWVPADRSRFVRAPCRPLGGGLLLQRGLLSLAARRDLDTVIFLGNAKHLVTWPAAARARALGKRVLFWTHGWTEEETGPKDRLRRAFYRLADGLLLYGHRAKCLGVARGFAPERLHVIYNSLDYEAQRRARDVVGPADLERTRAELFGQPERPIAICTGRLTGRRRLDLLLDAMHLLRAEGRPLNLLLVGEGPARRSLEEQAARMGLPVRFGGACYDEGVLARLIMAACVSVVPAGAGLSVVHSLGYGTPVVAQDDPNGQGPEWEAIRPGVNGGLFRRGDAADLARAIAEWTGPDRRSAADRRRCREVVERFYNPAFQRRAIERAIAGLPADDLFWQREERPAPIAATG
ncbi:MAG: glycosyltransferase [Chthonomonadales bacterium]|nr:glycosyltransferase [Chthonomonadales bacterium]